jgi:hypothetical protein
MKGNLSVDQELKMNKLDNPEYNFPAIIYAPFSGRHVIQNSPLSHSFFEKQSVSWLQFFFLVALFFSTRSMSQFIGLKILLYPIRPPHL